jgi:anti-sigma regulatory factor (Ser/Thr protein kinase)
MLAAREALGKLLADRGRVVVDLSELAGVAAGGAGVPGGARHRRRLAMARLVLCAAQPELALALRVGRVTDRVPLVAGPDQARHCLARPAPAGEPARRRALPSRVPGGARSFVRELCSDWEIPQLLEPGEIVVTELVSNAVEHARSSCRLTTAYDGRGLHVGVRDFGAAVVPRVRLIEVTAVRGRGLHIVTTLSSSWGVTEHADGKMVWANLAADH